MYVRELTNLRDQNEELSLRLADLENTSRCSNVRSKGVPLRVDAGKLEDFVTRLFRYVAPVLEDQEIVLDRTHRAGRPARNPGQSQDILTCLHSYLQKEIMATTQDKVTIQFKACKWASIKISPS